MTLSRGILSAASVAWLSLALALAVVLAWRGALTLAYGGGRLAFDERFEHAVAQLASDQPTARAAAESVVANWRPNTLWQRELLWGTGLPERFCYAEVGSETAPGLSITCGRIEIVSPPRAGMPPPRANPDLADYAHAKAVWLAARALRMSGRWRSEVRVTVTQNEPRASGASVQYVATLIASEDAPADALAEYASRHLSIELDQVSGLSAPNRAVARLTRRQPATRKP